MTGAPDPAAQHDPGGRVRIRLPDGVAGEAQFSPCGRYRQTLVRDWTPAGTVPRAVVFVGMNPSVADAAVSDPTCHRELGFARRWGFTRYLKANMLDWRATSPRDLPADPGLAASPANLPAILALAAEAEQVVLAYGKLAPRYAPVVATTLEALRATGKPLFCLGRNADGSAKHPLYLRADSPLIAF